MKKQLLKQLLENTLPEEKIKELFTIDFKEMVMESVAIKKLYVSSKKIEQVKNRQSPIDLFYAKNEKYRYFKNYLRYKILYLCGLVHEEYRQEKKEKAFLYISADCDTLKMTGELLKRIYDVEEISPTNELRTPGRYFQKDGVIFESDTMHSVGTLWHVFLKKYLQDYYGCTLKELCDCTYERKKEISTTLTEGFRLEKENGKVLATKINKILQFYWVLENFSTDKLFLYQTDTLKEIIKQFDFFALLTHTLGNFVLVPFKTNTYRGMVYKDYWVLFYQALLKKKIKSHDIYAHSKMKQAHLEEQIFASLKKYELISKKELDDERKFFSSINFEAIDTHCSYETILEVLQRINDSILKRSAQVIKICMPDCKMDINKVIENVKKEFLENE